MFTENHIYKPKGEFLKLGRKGLSIKHCCLFGSLKFQLKTQVNIL